MLGYEPDKTGTKEGGCRIAKRQEKEAKNEWEKPTESARGEGRRIN